MRSAGAKRHIGRIQRLSTDTDASGRPTGDPTTIAAGVPMSIRSVSGTEVESANLLVPQATHVVGFTYLHSITLHPKHQIVFDGRTFEIGWIDDVDEVKREQSCLVKEVVE